MAVLEIRVFPDPILNKKAKRVRNIDDSIKKLIDDMIETMRSVPGRAGLAAPQIGVSLRVIVIGLTEEEDIVLVNPEIVKKAGERPVDEGCLSVPGYVGQIKRAESITVKGRNRDGKEIRIKADGLLAQALEHEIDHVNGVLYLDHLESGNAPQKIEPEEVEN